MDDPRAIDPRVDLGITRTITVVGTRLPTVTAVRIPPTVAYGGKQYVRYTYRTAAGKPIVGATVLWTAEYGCPRFTPISAPGYGSHLRTDAYGRITRLLDNGFADGRTCVFLFGPPRVAGDPSTSAIVFETRPYLHQYYKSVTAAPTTSRVRVGRTLTVVGSVSPQRGVVSLQRLTSRGWRTAGSARIRTSGRYTVVALVPTVGRGTYRVVASKGDATLAPTSSRTFVVTGTRR